MAKESKWQFHSCSHRLRTTFNVSKIFHSFTSPKTTESNYKTRRTIFVKNKKLHEI